MSKVKPTEMAETASHGVKSQSPSPPLEFKDTIVWYNVFILALWHIGAIYACTTVLPLCSYTELIVLWAGLWFASGLGITAGAHRLWAHRSYKASPTLKTFLMLMNSMAFQGSIFEWSRDHRIHHKGSETTSDPHDATRGFFFSHCGWVMVRKHPDVIREGKKINCDDLLNDKIVMFQKSNYFFMALFWCYIVPTVIGTVCFNSPSKGFWIGGVFRHVWVLHMTWCVNSVAHFWGSHPYADIRPAENLFVSIGAIGEGWHNYHHKYPQDYATGEFGMTSGQWNPTKMFIDGMAQFGHATDMKRSRTAKGTREKREAMAAAKAASEPSTWWQVITSKFFFGRTEEEIFD